jgi:hypothetical protein
VYSQAAALTLSANVAALLFMALFVGWWVLRRLNQVFQARRWGVWLAPVALAAGMAVYFLGLPKVAGLPIKVTRFYGASIRSDIYYLADALADEITDTNLFAVATSPARPLSPGESEALLQATLRDYQQVWSRSFSRQSPLTNLFTGGPIRLEASPGNLVLRPAVRVHADPGGSGTSLTTNGYELVWHDLDGAEAITNALRQW